MHAVSPRARGLPVLFPYRVVGPVIWSCAWRWGGIIFAQGGVLGPRDRLQLEIHEGVGSAVSPPPPHLLVGVGVGCRKLGKVPSGSVKVVPAGAVVAAAVSAGASLVAVGADSAARPSLAAIVFAECLLGVERHGGVVVG